MLPTRAGRTVGEGRRLSAGQRQVGQGVPDVQHSWRSSRSKVATERRRGRACAPLQGLQLGGTAEADHPSAAHAQITESVRREVLRHRNLPPHPNVIKFLEAFVTDTHLAIVLEYAEAGELLTHLVNTGRPYSEARAQYYFRQLTVGVTHLHENVRPGLWWCFVHARQD